MYDHFRSLLRSRKLSHHCLALMRVGVDAIEMQDDPRSPKIDRALASAFDNCRDSEVVR